MLVVLNPKIKEVAIISRGQYDKRISYITILVHSTKLLIRSVKSN